MKLEKFLQNWWGRWGLILGVWMLFGLFLTSQVILAYTWLGRPFRWERILEVELAYAGIWAALTPLILWLSRRYRIERGHWVRNLFLHLLASLLIGFTIRAIHDVLFWLVADDTRPLSLASLLLNIYLIFDYGMLIYWVILLISYAIDFYHRHQEGEKKTSRLQAQLAQAQLQALKMQLHPHFLFNTLHSISALMHKNIHAAETMIARLGDFLRLTLENAGSQEVSLRQELDFLKCYLEIERIRFQDRLTVNLEIEPQTLDARLPNLILQPIVENAIRHGVSARPGPGLIDIQARRYDGMLNVQVTDNGPGLPPETALGNAFKEGLGLSNTLARLQQVYGPAHRLDLANAPLGGLTVTIEIPFKSEPNGKK
jgi:two-component system LytT family sensor kinase